MRAGIYLRISQDRRGDELGVTRQREDCEQLAADRGWDVVRVYVDNDVSATSGRKRPEWEAMMRDVEAGRLDAIIGWTLDRTLRSGRDRLRMLESGKEHRLVVALVRGSDMDLSTPAGRFAADILGAVAQNETDTKTDRQIRAIEQAAQQGRFSGGRRPFGFEPDGMTVRPDEAAAIASAYRDYLAGVPLGEIAKRWNAAGLLSGVPDEETGKQPEWGTSGVRWVLRNPRYIGQRVHKGEVVARALWPALVDEVTFRRVSVLLDSSASKLKPRGGRRLLTGVAVCGVCGEGIHAGGNRSGRPPLYRCPTGHVTRKAEPIEEMVGELVFRRLQRPDVLELLARSEDDGEAARLAVEAQEVRDEMDLIADERVQGKLTARSFARMNDGYMQRLADLEARMATASRTSSLRELVAGGVTREGWEALGVDRQRAYIAATAEVTLHRVGKGSRGVPAGSIGVVWRAS